MALGLIGKKCGMTRIFTEEGDSIPVTVIEIFSPHRVAQLRTLEKEGYRAVQVAYGSKKSSHINKPTMGHLQKMGVGAAQGLKEFRLNEKELPDIKVGDAVNVDIFQAGQRVDVRGLTRGKGFAGVIKRHHFTMQDATHGNSLSHRAHGSTGQRQDPGKVFKNKKMAGHMGDAYRTARYQEVIRVDVERNLLLIKGAVPGAPDNEVVITLSTKKQKRGS